MQLTSLMDLPELGVSHNPEIKKKVFIPNGTIPNLTTFGFATFKPGQSVENHKHDTMFEVFYIQSGQAVFTINDQEITLKPGDCLTISPGEVHNQNNPFEADVTWIYFGIAID